MATQVITQNGQYNIGATQVVSSGLLTPQSLPAALSFALNYTNATTGALTCDQMHAKVYSLLVSTPQTIDLTSLTDLNGNAMNFARVRDIVFYNPNATVTHTVTVYAGASNGWAYLPATPGLTVLANGGMVWLHDPNSATGIIGMVTSGSSKTITMDPGALATALSVYIIGNSVT